MKRVSCALALSMLAAAAPASAVVTLTSYSFTASGFSTSGSPANLPISSVTGTYSLAYDSSNPNNATAVTLVAFGLNLNGTTFNLANTGYQFLPPTTNPKTLEIGGAPSGIGGIAANTTDFQFTYSYLPDYSNFVTTGGIFPSPNFSVTLAGFTGIRTASTLAVTRLSSIVLPEPAGWAMMILGFGMVGAALRTSRLAPRRFVSRQSRGH